MSKPAARVGDMHVCPMQTPGVPPIPHVGGLFYHQESPSSRRRMPAATLTANAVV